MFVWVAGHCGLKGNDLADKAAGEASHLDQRSLAVLGSSLRSVMRSAIRRKCVWEHPRCERVYSSGMSAEREGDWSREDAVSMARLRSGHSLELGAYCQRIGKLQDGACRRCFEGSEDTEHVLKCEAGLRRRRLEGLPDQPCLDVLVLRY